MPLRRLGRIYNIRPTALNTAITTTTVLAISNTLIYELGKIAERQKSNALITFHPPRYQPITLSSLYTEAATLYARPTYTIFF